MPSMIPLYSPGYKRKTDMPGTKSSHRLVPEENRVSKILEQRRSLPISSAEKRLVEEIRRNETLIIAGETGSGKTTQLAQYLHAAGFCKGAKMVGITQPRRVAAVTVATRVAEEMGVQVGNEVGYSIRFEDATSFSTRLKYMTDGMLLREALLDPLLQRYSVIILDEAHERTIHTDVLFGLLKDVQKRRQDVIPEPADKSGEEEPTTTRTEQVMEMDTNQKVLTEKKLRPLKLVVMSATLDTKTFSRYFGGAKAVYIRGRQYPVQIFNTYTAEADYLDAAVITTFQVHLEEMPGDILVFLTGQEEIESMERLLRERATHLPEGTPKLLVVPIYAALPSDQQIRVFQPTPEGTRKIILATNIAETSLTIPGIRYVIDPGLVKARAFNPCTGIESLTVVPISKAQALQRSGRAGREAPGKCFRLYTLQSFEKLEESTVPEIKRSNLANVVLQLKALGIDDILGFDFMDKPSRAAIIKALEQLYSLGALTREGQLSNPIGLQMAKFPLEPMYSKAILISCDFKCLEEMLSTVALLSVESIFVNPHGKIKEANAVRQRFWSPYGDHITLINVLRTFTQEAQQNNASAGDDKADKKLRKWCSLNFINGRALRRALDIRRQVQGHVEGLGLSIVSCGDDLTIYRRCLAAAFFLNAAGKQPNGSYRAMASGQVVSIHPSSSLFGKKPDCVIFNELVRTNRQYIRSITQIDSHWLAELAPQYYSARDAELASISLQLS